MTKMVYISLVMITHMVLGATVHAKTLYVNSSNGNDATSYAENSATAPWRSLGRATWGSTNRTTPVQSQAAQAGDTVLVTGGPHIAPGTDIRYDPAFNPVNSGTATAPIIFRSVGRVELRTDGVISPVIGALNRNHIHWNGFVIDERFSPPRRDTGPIVAWASTGTVIDGTEVIGVLQTYGDNHNGVRVEGATDTTIRNTRISGIRGTNTAAQNAAGVMIYASNGILIENNEFTDCGAGVFAKGNNYYNATIRFNKISGSTKGIRTTNSHPTLGQNRVYQNIILNTTDGGPGIQVAENSSNWTIVNNTIISAPIGIYLRNPATVINLQIGNNIIVGATSGINAAEWPAPMPAFGRNLYHSTQNWALGSGIYTSLAAWQTAAPVESTSIVADPRFINPATGDYKLLPESPARTLGRDILDLNSNGSTTDVVPAGAYITGNEIIGRTTAPVVPPTPLQAPTRVEVR